MTGEGFSRFFVGAERCAALPVGLGVATEVVNVVDGLLSEQATESSSV